MTSQVVLVAVLVLVNASLAGTEMAMVSLRETQIERLAAASSGGERLARLASSPSRFLATIQVGITLASFAASASAAVGLSAPVAQVLEPALGASADAIAVALVTVVLAFISLVLGELVPKAIALQSAERWALAAALPLTILQKATAPVVWLLQVTSNAVVRLLGFDPDPPPDEPDGDELRELVSGAGDLDEFHRDVLDGAFEVAERKLVEIMTPRRRVFTLDGDLQAAEARRQLAASGFSRAPVVGVAGLDDVVGVVHLRDLLDMVGPPDEPTRSRARSATVLPESALVLGALRLMQERRSQLAVVVDERGGAEGIVTVEDIVEEVVGAIYDETDRVADEVERDDDGSLLLPGLFPLHELPDLGVELGDLGDTVGRQSTVAGLVLALLGAIPDAPGSQVDVGTWRFEVRDLDGHVIRRLAVRRRPDESMDLEPG